MCILCVIQKWSRRIATMLPWLVIPLIGLWALSQLLPPAFRFEITSPRLACVFVLLVTLFWYEILMPQLSAWRVRRNARLRERKRFEAIEMQKLKKTATRRCRNCLTPYRDQNPGGGKFMCSYCGHISKRPVLDLPVPPGMGNSGILKDLVGKGEKILNGKAWSDNGWICGQDWLDNANWGSGPFSAKSGNWKKDGEDFFGGDDHCLAENSYSRVFLFACKAFTTSLLSIMWLWRKIFRFSSSRDDASADAERRAMSEKRGDTGGNGPKSRGEKARRKAEEKRQARLEKELLEEEERKQREEVARLVEERRRMRDEKMEGEKERVKGSPHGKDRESKKEAERKHLERKKEKDRGSSKSNSVAEELERRVSKESDRNKKTESDRREQQKNALESIKTHSTDVGNGFKANSGSHNRGNVGTRYLDRMRGTILSSSRAFTGGGFFSKSTTTSANSVSREYRPNTSVDHAQTSTHRKETVQPNRVPGRSNVNADGKSVNRPVVIEPQPCTAPKKSWQQLFTRSPSVSLPTHSNVISRPDGNPQTEVWNLPFSGHHTSAQSFDNPINFGHPSPFTLPPFSLASTSSGTGLPLSSDVMFPRIGDAPNQFLPEESETFEDPCYVPDPVSLLGPVSESLDDFQLDIGFVTGIGSETPSAVKTIAAPSEVTKPSPIESPLSRSRILDERHPNSFLFSSTPKTQDTSNSVDEPGTWQMWNSLPLGQDGLGFVGGPPSWLLRPELKMPNKDDIVQPVPHKTMASLFKKEEQAISGGSYSPQNGLLGNFQNGGAFNNSVQASNGNSWLPKTYFGPTSSNDDLMLLKPHKEVPRDGLIYGSSGGTPVNHQFEISPSNSWTEPDWTMQGSRDAVGSTPVGRPHTGGLYPPSDVQSVWSYD